jgi:hypothetical protein
MACGTLATNAIVLKTIKKFNEIIPFYNNPAFSGALMAPRFLGKALPKKGFGGAQLAFSLNISNKPGDYIYGLLYDACSLPAPDIMMHMPLTRRGSMELTNLLLPSLMVMLLYFPGKYSKNHIKVLPSGEVHVQGNITNDFNVLYERMIKEIRARFLRIGFFLLPKSSKIYAPGADSHYAGGLASAGLVSHDGGVIGEHNLYVVDGSALSILPAKSHTFTIMANADRIGKLLALKLKKAQTI